MDIGCVSVFIYEGEWMFEVFFVFVGLSVYVWLSLWICFVVCGMVFMVVCCVFLVLFGVLEFLFMVVVFFFVVLKGVFVVFLVKKGLELVLGVVLRGVSSVWSVVWSVESRVVGVCKVFKGVRVSGVGVMESVFFVMCEDFVIVNVDFGDWSYFIYIGVGLFDWFEFF